MKTIIGYVHFTNMLLNLGSLLLELTTNGTFNVARFSATLGWGVAWMTVILMVTNEN